MPGQFDKTQRVARTVLAIIGQHADAITRNLGVGGIAIKHINARRGQRFIGNAMDQA